jgi:hypothetical protein
MATSPDQSARGDAADIPPPPRGLKTAVVIMGVLLIVGFIIVFGTIIYRVVAPGDEAGDAAAPRGVYGAVDVALPAGAAIVSTGVSGDRAVVRIRAGDGTESLVVLDLRRGHELGRFRLTGE